MDWSSFSLCIRSDNPIGSGEWHLINSSLTILIRDIARRSDLVGLAFTAWLIARGMGVSVYMTVSFLSIIPFLLLDNLHHVHGNGMVVFTVWIAILGYNATAEVVPKERSDVSPSVES